jgi:hypothetical protein
MAMGVRDRGFAQTVETAGRYLSWMTRDKQVQAESQKSMFAFYLGDWSTQTDSLPCFLLLSSLLPLPHLISLVLQLNA